MTPKPCFTGERGQAAVIVAVMMVGILGMLGLIVDGGMLLAQRRAVQNAVDAAATAAAVDLAQGYSASTATASALYYAEENGFDNDGTTNRVEVNIPPTSGPWSGNNNFAQVTITQTVTTYFIQVVSLGRPTAYSSAIGGVSGAAAPHTILTLNPTACGSLSGTLSGNFTVGGGIMVDSSCTTGSKALNFTSSGNLQAASIGVVGGYNWVGSGSMSPVPQTGIAPEPDPLAGLAPPSFTGLTVRNGTPASPSTLTIVSSSPVTLQPGIYYGGINIISSANVTLQPGIYIMAGGGFRDTGSGNLTGNGVFLYNTNDPSHPSGAGAYGRITLTTSGTVSLTPPGSGTYKNLLFFQDRSNTQPVTITGSGALNTQGTLYFPAAPLSITASGNALAKQIICDRATITMSGNFNIPYSASAFYSTAVPALVQ